MSLVMPRYVFVAGKKRAGKDYLADALVDYAGYEKVHIAAPWLLDFYRSKGYNFWSYDEVPLELRTRYRAEIQTIATKAREHDPEVLIRLMREYIEHRESAVAFQGREPAPLVVSGVRFKNEALYAIRSGYFVVQVAVPDDVRRVRFLDAGEDLALFDDPFEADLGPQFPCHVIVSGDLFRDAYVPQIGAAYGYLRQAQAAMLLEAKWA